MNQLFENNDSKLKQPVHTSRKAIAAGVIILIAGIVIGWAGATLTHRIILHRLIENPQRFTNHIKKHLTRELNLNENQAKKVDEIIEMHAKKLLEIEKQLVAQVSDQLDQVEKEVSILLDDEQKKIWQHQMKKIREHMPKQ